MGQIANAGTAAMSDSISRRESNLTSWITASQANKEQITQTVYDLAYPGFTGLSFTPIEQRNLRNRVAYTSYTQGANATQYNQGTFYTYDIEGNVDTLLQDYGSSSFSAAQNIMNLNGNRFKRMVYRYDLVSGKVNSVAYQPHQVDAMYHRYTYDAENRLVLAETSQDSVFWDKDARYEYYKHGPLARVIIGDKMVQGLDYAYTLQGWLKGVNSTSLSPLYDMGRDGDTSRQNRYVARDAYGFSLNYYTGDYSPIGTVAPFPGSSAYLDTAYRPLFNGNISSMAVNIGTLYQNDSHHWRGPMLYNYKYDQLNRITRMDAWYGLNQGTNSWVGLTPTADFKERVSYDGNGNIQKYLRNNFGETGLPMDSLGYKYLAGTNKLTQIRDSASDAIGGGYDLHSQPAGNYSYDSIGNLIRDSAEHISSIKWNVYGKITEIDHGSTSISKPVKNIFYYYDAAGNRIGKKTTRGDTTGVSYTWYVRDASGNVMATYTASLDSSQTLGNADLHIGEKHIYGSSRLGLINANYSTDANTDGLTVYTSPWTGMDVASYAGKKQYELANHLGNVLATITDKKIGVSLSSDSSLIDHYVADVQTAQDYYPFGMVMPGRMFTALTIPGGSVSGTTQVNGYTLPVDLSLTSRSGNEPTQYTATRTIDLEDGFTSGVNDDVTAYLSDSSYAGTGNGGSDASGVAGQGKYRYGFNGKENDNEVKGVGNEIDYGMRVYDPRAGRFLSTDPLFKSYPELSYYQYASNNPIHNIDIDGLEGMAGNLCSPGKWHIPGDVDDNGIIDPQELKAAGKTNLAILKLGVYGLISVYQPQVGIPLMLTEISGVPVIPSPQIYSEAIAGRALNQIEEGISEETSAAKGTATSGTTSGSLTKATSKTVVQETNMQTITSNGGNNTAATSNTTATRPSWQQSEYDLVGSDYEPQVSFKNGNWVKANTKGSVRPEGYQVGQSIEVKNYNLSNEKGIKSLISNVVKQVKQRQSNLPRNTVQNIVLDVRGQNLSVKQMQNIRSRLSTQTGSKKVNISFKTD